MLDALDRRVNSVEPSQESFSGRVARSWDMTSGAGQMNFCRHRCQVALRATLTSSFLDVHRAESNASRKLGSYPVRECDWKLFLDVAHLTG